MFDCLTFIQKRKSYQEPKLRFLITLVLMKLMRFLLFPFAILYALVTSIRNVMFDVGIFNSASYDKPVIAVGNLSVGGTGKTPQIEYLISLLKEHYKIAVLSRGYGRATKGFVLATKEHLAADIGDEPLQFFKKFPEISVAVDEDRVHGISKLESAQILLLDDAFQHRKVKAGLYVLLTKYNDLFSNDFVLPTGNLRERRVGAKRANVVVVTKCPDTIDVFEKEAITKLIRRYFNGPIFFTKIAYAKMLQSFSLKSIATKDLNDYEVLLLTGIANPTPLLNFLREKRVKFTHKNFSDHHVFSKHEINEIKHEFKSLPSSKKIILTTEKDYVRLENKLDTLYYLAIETCFVDRKEEFDQLLTEYVKNSL